MYSDDPYAQDGRPSPFSPVSGGKGTQAGKPAPTNRYGPYKAAAEAYGQRQQPQRQASPYGDMARGQMQGGQMPMQRPMQQPMRQPMQARPQMGMRRPGFGGVSPQNPYGNGGGY
jgi:hypothetical protein